MPGARIGSAPGGHVGDVAVVGVEEVEHRLDLGYRLREARGRRDRACVQREEGTRAQGLAATGGALLRQRDAPPSDRGVSLYDAMGSEEEPQTLVGQAGRAQGSRLEHHHLAARAPVEVMAVVPTAQRLRERVDVVALRRRDRPREVRATADENERQPG